MQTTPRKYLKTLTIIHAALISGPLLLGVFLFTTTEILPEAIQNKDDVFIYVFPLLGMIGIFASKFIFKQLLGNVLEKKSLQEKLAGFQTASLVQYVLVEGPAFINLVWFGTSGNSLFLTVAGVLLIYLFTIRPTATKIIEDLQLKGEEARKFNTPDQPL